MNSRYDNYFFDGKKSVPDCYNMLGSKEEPPTVYHVISPYNQCFVCDMDITKDDYYVTIINGVITETMGNLNQNVLPLIRRCQECKLGKYGMPITSNNMTILARHYKWMTFLSGFYDVGSCLSDIPFDVAKLIILLYEYIR